MKNNTNEQTEYNFVEYIEAMQKIFIGCPDETVAISNEDDNYVYFAFRSPKRKVSVWKSEEDDDGFYRTFCPVCGQESMSEFEFCPKCGTRMLPSNYMEEN